MLSCVQFFAIPWTVTHQAPLSVEILQARTLEWVAMPSPGDLPNPGIEPRSPLLQAGSLLSEPPGKPKNTGVGSLSFLQGIFLTQELNQGLLHCRQILYQLSYQGSPSKGKVVPNTSLPQWVSFLCKILAFQILTVSVTF